MTFVGFKWEGKYYITYNYLPFGLSKVMRELVMFWRRDGINLLPYLDDFMSMKSGFWQCVRMAFRMERDFVRAGKRINVTKCHSIPAQQRRQLGFDVVFAQGKFQVHADRWEALKMSASVLLSARNGGVHARNLARLTGTVIFMHLSLGPVARLYTRHLYALINSMMSLNLWVVLTEEAINELSFWHGLPCLEFEGSIWPPTVGVSVRMASDANDIG